MICGLPILHGKEQRMQTAEPLSWRENIAGQVEQDRSGEYHGVEAIPHSSVAFNEVPNL
jgi:hypothetical protein